MKESRIEAMADYIAEHTNISIEQLTQYFNVSIYTVRRDIDELVKRNIVTKRYGGVSINKVGTSMVQFDSRNEIHIIEKKTLSRIAASLIEDGDIIFIDGGTTTLYIPDYIEDKKITVVTNNAYIIPKLIQNKNIKLVVLGGEVDSRTGSMVGIDTIEFFQKINVSKAFLACTGISYDFDLTNYTVVEAELKKACIRKSEKSYLLADHSKFGVSSLVTYGKINQLSGIITNKELPDVFLNHCKENEVKCYHE